MHISIRVLEYVVNRLYGPLYSSWAPNWEHLRKQNILGPGDVCRKYIEKLKATQKGRAHPDPGFKKDKNMRLYKIFKHVEHKSARLSHMQRMCVCMFFSTV